MLYAVDQDGSKIKPEKGQRALCPGCGGTVKAKCGSIKIWHWAHQAKSDCTWYTSETEWHLAWKSIFPPEQVEICINKRRADRLEPNGTAWEFQHSSISPETIKEREADHKDVVWVFDVTKFKSLKVTGEELKNWYGQTKFHLYHPFFDANIKNFKVSFRWGGNRPYFIKCCEKHVLLDFGNIVVLFLQIQNNIQTGEWIIGDAFDKQELMKILSETANQTITPYVWDSNSLDTRCSAREYTQSNNKKYAYLKSRKLLVGIEKGDKVIREPMIIFSNEVKKN